MKKRFSSWNEVAENSVNELLNFIGVGIGTVESIVTELDRQIMAGLNTRPLDAYQSDRNIPPILNFRKFASLMEWAELHFSSTGVTLGALSQLDLSNLPAQVHAELENLLSFEIVKPEPPKRSIAAVLQEIRERLEPRGLEILRRRHWTGGGPTLEQLGEEFGLTRERIRQIEASTISMLRSLVDSEADLYAGVSSVQKGLGCVFTDLQKQRVLNELGFNLSSDDAGMLLWLAGPFTKHESELWYQSESGQFSLLLSKVRAAILSTESLTHADLQDLLSDDGVVDTSAITILLERICQLRRFNDTWHHWAGSVVDKAAKLLSIAGYPMSAEILTEKINEGHSFRTLLNGMSVDKRFMRVTKKEWGLSSWGLEEYSGIVDSIVDLLHANGGRADAEWVVDQVSSTFKVARTSVRAYLSTLAFEIADGFVSERKDWEGMTISAPIYESRGTYKVDQCINQEFIVTRDVLRGSGQAVPKGLAKALNVRPNITRHFKTEQNFPIVVGWRPWAINGPDIGSIREIVAHVDGKLGDRVLINFDTQLDRVEVKNLSRLGYGDDYLAALCGNNDSSTMTSQMALAIESNTNQLEYHLRNRGDEFVADIVFRSQATNHD
jgi:hypothetical protein